VPIILRAIGLTYYIFVSGQATAVAAAAASHKLGVISIIASGTGTALTAALTVGGWFINK